MIEVKKKENCCGCGACVDICKHNCISMKMDDEGFCYPIVNQVECVSCKRCLNVCPMKNQICSEAMNEAYAMQTKDPQLRMKSSSGGIFGELARIVLNKGGCVVGAKFREKLSVEHCIVNNMDELENLFGSKYLQSSMVNVYNQVLTELKKERMVLFVGTPCQIAALKTFLKKKYENLVLVDFICHGVPSELVWRKYLTWKENKKQNRITKVGFRDKATGWKKYSMYTEYDSKEIEIVTHGKDLFFNVFLDDIILRPSCYSCRYKGYSRVSDITLGDLWGIETLCPKLDDDLGTSLVLTNTAKGSKLVDQIKDRCVYSPVNRADALNINSASINSADRHLNQKKFYKNLDRFEFDYLVNKMTHLNLFQRIILKVKRKVIK